jgi:hypothetical protein
MIKPFHETLLTTKFCVFLIIGDLSYILSKEILYGPQNLYVKVFFNAPTTPLHIHISEKLISNTISCEI